MTLDKCIHSSNQVENISMIPRSCFRPIFSQLFSSLCNGSPGNDRTFNLSLPSDLSFFQIFKQRIPLYPHCWLILYMSLFCSFMVVQGMWYTSFSYCHHFKWYYTTSHIRTLLPCLNPIFMLLFHTFHLHVWHKPQNALS